MYNWRLLFLLESPDDYGWSLLQSSLIHLELQQVGLGTARRRRVVPFAFIEGIAAFV